MNATSTSKPAAPTAAHRHSPIGSTAGDGRACGGDGNSSSDCSDGEVCIGCQLGAEGAPSRTEGTAGAGVAMSPASVDGDVPGAAPAGAHVLGAGAPAETPGGGVGRADQSIGWPGGGGVGPGVGAGVATVAMSGPVDNGRGGWRAWLPARGRSPSGKPDVPAGGVGAM